MRLTILHTNDIHGRQERIAQIATIVEREKARAAPPPTLPKPSIATVAPATLRPKRASAASAAALTP